MPASRPTWLLESLEFQWPASPCPHSLPSLVFPFSHPPRHTCEWQIQGDLDPADHQGAKPGGSRDDQLGSGQPLDAFPGQWSGSWPGPPAPIPRKPGKGRSLPDGARPVPSEEPVWHQSQQGLRWDVDADVWLQQPRRARKLVPQFPRLCETRIEVLSPHGCREHSLGAGQMCDQRAGLKHQRE